MTKWPVHKQTLGNSRQHAKHQYLTYIENKLIAENWFKPSMKVIDCTNAFTQIFLENSFKIIYDK